MARVIPKAGISETRKMVGINTINRAISDITV
jgi:hypothetical protein